MHSRISRDETIAETFNQYPNNKHSMSCELQMTWEIAAEPNGYSTKAIILINILRVRTGLTRSSRVLVFISLNGYSPTVQYIQIQKQNISLNNSVHSLPHSHPINDFRDLAAKSERT
jgi:hypothetical protein